MSTRDITPEIKRAIAETKAKRGRGPIAAIGPRPAVAITRRATSGLRAALKAMRADIEAGRHPGVRELADGSYLSLERRNISSDGGREWLCIVRRAGVRQLSRHLVFPIGSVVHARWLLTCGAAGERLEPKRGLA